jgi:cysteine desulfurase / selenocysteine lyase
MVNPDCSLEKQGARENLLPWKETAMLHTSIPHLITPDFRADFPLLERVVNDKRLIYLDSTATSLKPRAVLNAMRDYYERVGANVHRGVYSLSSEATDLYEAARGSLARFLHAPRPESVIFTRNTTEAINLVAYAWGLEHLHTGDEVIVTELEHHSNLVSWQIVAALRGAMVKAVRITPEGRLDLEHYRSLLQSGHVRMVAVAHVSNAIGTIHPVAWIAAAAHEVGALCLVDGAQGAPHLPVDVQAIGADFYALSGHKMLGPTGSGVLWGRLELLRAMPPFLGGGEMIREVFVDRATYAEPPQRFEAGTPAIAEAIGLGAAAEYLLDLGMDWVRSHERALTQYALERFDELEGVTTYGPQGEDRGGVIAFNVNGVHPHDVASFLDEDGICVRAGHHCAQPAMRALGLQSTARASFGVYSTLEDVDALLASLERCRAFFA